MANTGGISLGRVTVQLLLGRAIGYVLLLVNSVVLARALGVDRLGEYAYAMGVAALFGLVPNLGVTAVITRAIAHGDETGGGVVRTALLVQRGVAVLVLAAIPTCAALLPEQPVPTAYVILAAAQLALGSLSWPYLAVLSGRARFDLVAKNEVFGAGAATVCLLGAVTLRNDVPSVLAAQVLAAGVAVIIARRAAVPLIPIGGERPSMRSVIRQAMPFGAAAAVQSLYAKLDLVLLGQMAGAAVVGLYSAAYKPVTLAVYFGGTLAGALFPLMARPFQHAPAAFSRTVRGLLAAAPAMALLLTGLAGPLLQALYGREFRAAAPMIMVLAWSAAANWICAPFSVALQAGRREHEWLAALVGALGVNVVGNLWAIPRWGGLGAAAVTVTCELALLGAALVLAGRTGKGLLLGARQWMIGFGVTAAGAGTLWVLQPYGEILATSEALAVYAGLLVSSRSVTIEDASSVIGWVRQAVSSEARA